MIQIAPSILSANFANLHSDLKHIHNADMLHIDVMDGHFVPNITMGIPVIASLKDYTDIPLDVHLMIEKPRLLMEAFCKADPDRITVHLESDSIHGTAECIKIMKKYGVAPGVALKPNTKATAILPFIRDISMVLVMTVEPGFGGQLFIDDQIQTVKEVKALCQQHNRDCLIQVDGGIHEDNAALVKKAGANVLVAGSAIFKDSHPKKMIEILRDAE